MILNDSFLQSHLSFVGWATLSLVALAMLAVLLEPIWRVLRIGIARRRLRNATTQELKDAEPTLAAWAAGEVPLDADRHDWLDGSPADTSPQTTTRTETR